MSEDFYSLVQRRIWTDAGFRKLSKPAPNARDLFLYLLTTPVATQIPGLVAIGEAAMAEDLEWSVDGLRKCLGELEQAGMVKVDRSARLLWLPNGLRHNPPRSPDNVKGWAKHWRLLPECSLLNEAAQSMMAVFVARGPTFAAAFGYTSGRQVPTPMGDPMGAPKADPKPAPYPAHQIQEQEQDPKQENKAPDARERASARGEDDDDGEDPEPTPDTTDGKVLAVLRASPPLAQCEREGLRLTQCALDLTVEVGKFTLSGKLRDDEAMERVTAAIADVAGKVQASNATTSPLSPDKVARLLATFAYTNLGKSRDAWVAEKNRGRPNGRQRHGPAAPNPAIAAFAPLPPDARPWTPDDKAPL